MATKTASAKPTKGKAASKAAPKEKPERKPRELSARQRAFQEKHSRARELAKGTKVMEHNRGLYWIQLGKNEYVVGRISKTGKSFDVEFRGDHAATYEYYKENRAGNYGKGRPAAPKKAKKEKASTSSRKRVAAEEDDLEDLLD